MLTYPTSHRLFHWLVTISTLVMTHGQFAEAFLAAGMMKPSVCMQMYYAEEKKSFKPGWKSLRPQHVIQQQEQRLQQELVKVTE